MVEVEHKQTHVVVTFIGAVNEQNIIELVNTIDQLHTGYFYRQVTLRIASPGGELLALEYFIEALAHWKQQNLPITTRALTSCSSAAAIMLSLGDIREASSSSMLLYHYSRIVNFGQNVPITSEGAEEISENLRRIDDKMRAKLVDRVLERDINLRINHRMELGDEDRIALKSIRLEWSNRTGEQVSADGDEQWFDEWLGETRNATSVAVLRQRWSTLYDTLLDEDKQISAALAVRLGLVDRLAGPIESSAMESPDQSAVHWFEIPEWRTAFAQGRVDERDLRRHTLILGETGSGKTKSAIVPALAAAYRSPRVGVGLIIDPKLELGTLLREWSSTRTAADGKRLVWIGDDGILIDLMANEKWSIREMVEKCDFWSAAQRILQRVSTMTHSNPARVLLGEPFTAADPYWAMEGTTFATTVVAIAVQFARYPTEFVDSECQGSAGEQSMWTIAKKRLCAVGAKMGLFRLGWRDHLDEAGIFFDTNGFPAIRLDRPVGGEANESPFGAQWLSHRELENRRTYQRVLAIQRLFERLKADDLVHHKMQILNSIEREWNDGVQSDGDVGETMKRIENEVLGEGDRDPPNVLTIASMLCDELFLMVEPDKHPLDENSNYTPLHAIADRTGRFTGGEFEFIARHVKKYADMRDTAEKQYAGIYGAGTTVWQEFTTKEIRNTIYFGCEPRLYDHPGKKGRIVSFSQDVERSAGDLNNEPGIFYVFEPDPHGLDNLIGKACKVLFFESVVGSSKRARFGEQMPLAAYVADEFQRFITADRVHGEQSFLDVCRAYGAFAVIACQSIASMRYALSNLERDVDKRDSAIGIICNNTATKIFFRSTDGDTAQRLETICPAMWDGVVLTKVRPLSTLAPGECYASFPDGRFERVQLEQFRKLMH